MSYSTARAKLVSIIAGITPTDTTLFQAPFVHLPSGRSGQGNPTSRSFWLEANVDGEGALRGPDLINLAQNPMHVVTMTLTVSYRGQNTRLDDFDRALESDRVDIARALLNPANWSFPTSGIMNVANGRDFLPTRRQPVTAGAVEQQVVFPLTYR